MKFGQFCNVDGNFAVSNRVGEPGIAGSHAAGPTSSPRPPDMIQTTKTRY